jgi:hypothetical protein
MANNIPQNDAEFNLWQLSFTQIVEPNLTQWSIPADDFTALKASQTDWNTAFAKASNKQNRTRADVQSKDDARDSFDKVIRQFIAQWLANNPKVLNSDRERMGLNIKQGTRKPVPIPVSCPVGTVDFSVRLQHTINYGDEATPRSKAKPAGVHGCEVWAKIDGSAPQDASELGYLGTSTSSPFSATFEGKNAAKNVYYWLRWVNTRGEVGPWSRSFSAMVAG